MTTQVGEGSSRETIVLPVRTIARAVERTAGLLKLTDVVTQIVKEPMDLKTMRHKVHTGQYNTLQEMRNDCELMSKNALLFNRAPGEVGLSRGFQ